MFILLSFNPIVLVKSFTVAFSLRRGKYFLESRVLEGYGWDDAPWDHLLVN
jgi:hypothetical protein